jgi:hypothetical protein
MFFFLAWKFCRGVISEIFADPVARIVGQGLFQASTRVWSPSASCESCADLIVVSTSAGATAFVRCL